MRHEAKMNAPQNYELPSSLVYRVSSMQLASPARPLAAPSDLSALLSSLPGILIMVVGFLLMFGPGRRPNLGAGLFFLGIAVMFAALAFLSLSPLGFSFLRSLQQTTEQRSLVDRSQFLEPVDYESLAVASSDPGSVDERASSVSGAGRYAVEPLREYGSEPSGNPDLWDGVDLRRRAVEQLGHRAQPRNRSHYGLARHVGWVLYFSDQHHSHTCEICTAGKLMKGRLLPGGQKRILQRSSEVLPT
jgi:hypothetical protein